MRRSSWALIASLLAVLCATLAYSSTGDSDNMALVGRWGGGPGYESDVVGTVAYWGNGAYLEIYDFANPAAPVKLGRVLVPGPIVGVDVEGSYAYLADSDDGLRIIDISNPATAHEVGFLDTPGTARDVKVVGNYAYVADGLVGGLRVINVSNPAAPVEAGFLDTASEARRLAISGSYAYIADNEDGLRVINVSNPAAPVEAGFLDTANNAYDVVVDGTYAYVADRFGGLLVIDVSNPAAPSQVGSLYTGYITNVGLGGGYVYTSGQIFVGVIDISNPATPVQVGSYDPLTRIDGGIAFAGGYAYMSDNYTGFFAVNVSAPAAPFEAGGILGNGDCESVAVSGDYAYVANYVGGLRILDVSDPSAPLEVGHFSYSGLGGAQDVAVSGNMAYVVGQGFIELRIINVSNPAAPFQQGFLDLPVQGSAVAMRGSYICVVSYVAAAGADFFLVDVSDPAAPFVAASLDLAGTDKRDVVVVGNYAYVAAYDQGLRIVDVSNPLAPFEVGSETSRLALGVDVDGSYAYVGAGGNSMTIIDVSNPAAPVLAGDANMNGSAWGVDAAGGYAYVANDTYGVRAFDVADPGSPVQVGFYDTASSTHRVVVDGDLIFATDGGNGFWILKLNLPTGIGDVRPTRPEALALHQNRPNPFNPTTTISFTLPERARVTLSIYDAEGRTVRVLVDETVGEGYREYVWDGKGASGRSVGSGVYFYRLTAGNRTLTKKMVLLK